jgi:hypothetical protein
VTYRQNESTRLHSKVRHISNKIPFVLLRRMGVEFNNPKNQLVYHPDGILPTDYPDAYEELLFTCCVHLTRPAYQFEHIFIYQDCYNDMDPEDQELHEIPPAHFLCGVPRRIRAKHCRICDIEISQTQPATSCLECIAAHMDLNETEKNYVAFGKITRPVPPLDDYNVVIDDLPE